MPRAIWSGAITFGMISIPVKLYGATESKDVAFNTLHDACKSRVKQKRWCPVHDREVAADEVVRAYEYAKEQYVVVTDAELEQLPVASKHTIELTAFVKHDEVDPVYLEKSYYLEPEQVGLKPYALLLRVLKARQVSAVAKVALRNRERPCLLRATAAGVLMLDTLYYPDEVRAGDLPAIPDVLVSEPELQMALGLVDLLAERFAPETFSDQYRAAVTDLIQAKLAGDDVVRPPEAAAPAPVDLMAALKASLEAVRKTRQADPTPAAAAAPKRAAAKKRAAGKKEAAA